MHTTPRDRTLRATLVAFASAASLSMGCGGPAFDSPPLPPPPPPPTPPLALAPIAAPALPPEPLPPGAVEEPCVLTADAQGRHVITATHTDPTLSLAQLAQVRVLGRVRYDATDLSPPGSWRYMAVAPVFVDAGRIAVRCDWSVKGGAYVGNSGYTTHLPVVTSVVFFMPPAPRR